jgi:hypothetical protein
MLRELIERFSYRYQLWVKETQGDSIGAGESLPEISPKSESAWHLVGRLLWSLIGGLVLLSVIARTAAHRFPGAHRGIGMICVYLGLIWSAVILFTIGGELLKKLSRDQRDRTDDKDPRNDTRI